MKYDIAVAGAGHAGCMAAYTSAKKGFKVCLIDAKSKEKIGDKICGNALGFHHLDKIGLKIPDEVITNKINGVIIYSPSLYFWDVPMGDYVVECSTDWHLASIFWIRQLVPALN